ARDPQLPPASKSSAALSVSVPESRPKATATRPRVYPPPAPVYATLPKALYTTRGSSAHESANIHRDATVKPPRSRRGPPLWQPRPGTRQLLLEIDAEIRKSPPARGAFQCILPHAVAARAGQIA